MPGFPLLLTPPPPVDKVDNPWDRLSVLELRALLREYPIDRTCLPAPIEKLRRAELVEALRQVQALGGGEGARGASPYRRRVSLGRRWWTAWTATPNKGGLIEVDCMCQSK
ncbi:MAG: hypothetical protein VKP70_09025 [Cyanobacteriota bacterium]|nr:hypothetical protein [Cyanobacteriota bacterium]